jgi:hypothetical protein
MNEQRPQRISAAAASFLAGLRRASEPQPNRRPELLPGQRWRNSDEPLISRAEAEALARWFTTDRLAPAPTDKKK